MKKLILAAAVAGAVLLSSAAQAQTTPEGYQLQQVLMMSRHNLRAPLANNGSVLEQSTPNQWPEWDVPGGQLTTTRSTDWSSTPSRSSAAGLSSAATMP